MLDLLLDEIHQGTGLSHRVIFVASVGFWNLTNF
jgi:hypothetical protein